MTSRTPCLPHAPYLFALIVLAHLHVGLWLLSPSPTPRVKLPTPGQVTRHHERLTGCAARADAQCFEEAARLSPTFESLMLGTALIDLLPATAERSRLRLAMLRDAQTHIAAQLAEAAYSDRARLQNWARYVEAKIRHEREWSADADTSKRNGEDDGWRRAKAVPTDFSDAATARPIAPAPAQAMKTAG